eukprot:4207684-Prymnesium_polylepis.1
MLLRTTITPQTTADPDTSTCDADSVACRERLQPDHAYLSHAKRFTVHFGERRSIDDLLFFSSV